MVSLILGIKH